MRLPKDLSFYKRLFAILSSLALAILFASCAAPAAEVERTQMSAEEPAAEAPEDQPPELLPTPVPLPTQLPQPTATAAATASVQADRESVVEPRVIELEWPSTMRLGDSDVVRLSLILDEDGYQVQADFPDHQIQSQSITVDRPPGYTLYASARMDGVGFEISPDLELERYLPPEEPVVWRWTITPRRAGQQRLSVAVRLRWKPPEGDRTPVRESMVLSKALDIRVVSFLGLTQSQAMMVGFLGLILGGGLSVSAIVFRPRSGTRPLRTLRPNPSLTLEPPADLEISGQVANLLRTLFSRYGRLVIAQEFPTGYSRAQTYLAQPIHRDGRTDAYTIAKIGPRSLIQQEFDNYETYVKDRLPPVTARIQQAPVTVRGSDLAGLQYTFIGAPGQPPRSLREALLADPDPSLLYKLFDTFGPNWWMQRKPYTFRISQEYDRVLPPHYIVGPADGRGPTLDGRAPPGDLAFPVGGIVTLRGFKEIERRVDGRSHSLHGAPHPGQPCLRVRWLSRAAPNGAVGKIVATRASFLAETVGGFDRFGLQDPLDRLHEISGETVQGTRSTIHGDLNVENILQGPGGIIWLIDFAQTREGHTLLDFAHLHAELIAHVLAARGQTPADYVGRFKTGKDPLLVAVREIAGRCLFDPTADREYDLALFMVCLGALKFVNVTTEAKHLLYLTAAVIGERLSFA